MRKRRGSIERRSYEGESERGSIRESDKPWTRNEKQKWAIRGEYVKE